MNQHEFDLLNQKVTVMQNEISQVINEMHVTVQGLAKMVTTALKLFDERIAFIEKSQSSNVEEPVAVNITKREGKDL